MVLPAPLLVVEKRRSTGRLHLHWEQCRERRPGQRAEWAGKLCSCQRQTLLTVRGKLLWFQTVLCTAWETLSLCGVSGESRCSGPPIPPV